MREEIEKRLQSENLKVSPVDERDYQMKSCSPKLNFFPDYFEQEYKDEYLDQGKVSSCVTHALSRVMTRIWDKLYGKLIKFSVGFIYGYRPENQDKTAGLYPIDALNNLKKYGNVPYTDFPYNEEVTLIYKLIAPLLINLLKIASKYKITAYTRLNNMDEYKSAIYQDHEVVVSIPFYEGWLEDIDWKTGKLGIPRPNSKRLYNHMVIGKGFVNKNEKILMNSWGKDLLPILILPDGYPVNEMWMVVKEITPEVSDTFVRIIVDKEYTDVDLTDSVIKKLTKYGIPSCIDMYKDKFIIQVKAFKLDSEAKAYLTKINVKKSGIKFKIVKY